MQRADRKLKYVIVKLTDMPVEVIKMDPNANRGISAVYISDTTRKLDAMYGLDGTPLSDEQKRRVRDTGMGIGETYSEYTMPFFTWVAGQMGRFVGLRQDEAENFPKAEVYINPTVSEGWLQLYEHEGAIIVEPTVKYGEHFARFGRVRKTADLQVE